VTEAATLLAAARLATKDTRSLWNIIVKSRKSVVIQKAEDEAALWTGKEVNNQTVPLYLRL
jgi:hypothetical protein